MPLRPVRDEARADPRLGRVLSNEGLTVCVSLVSPSSFGVSVQLTSTARLKLPAVVAGARVSALCAAAARRAASVLSAIE